ncbi:MAG: hypothetical protein WCF90_06630 [Methanomicrobiales archaeon]
MYEYCDLKWGSITASGFVAFIIGVATFLFPLHPMGFIIAFSAMVILILTCSLIAEELFIEGGGYSGGWSPELVLSGSCWRLFYLV